LNLGSWVSGRTFGSPYGEFLGPSGIPARYVFLLKKRIGLFHLAWFLKILLKQQ